MVPMWGYLGHGKLSWSEYRLTLALVINCISAAGSCDMASASLEACVSVFLLTLVPSRSIVASAAF